MIGKINIGKKFRILFVLRHKWETEKGKSIFWSRIEFKKKELGIFWRKTKAVGTNKSFKNCNGHSFMLGLNLIYVKCWIEFDYNVLHFEIKDKKI